MNLSSFLHLSLKAVAKVVIFFKPAKLFFKNFRLFLRTFLFFNGANILPLFYAILIISNLFLSLFFSYFIVKWLESDFNNFKIKNV